MKKIVRNSKRLQGITLIAVLVLQLFTLGVMAWEWIYALFLTFYSVLYYFRRYPRLRVNVYRRSPTIHLVVWGVLYAMLIYVCGYTGLVKGVDYYLVIPVTCVLMGYILNDVYIDSDTSMVNAVLLMCIGFSIHAVLNILYSIQNGTFIYNTERVYDIWTGDLNNRTIIGMYLLFLIDIALPVCLCGKGVIRWKWRVMAFCSVLLGCFFSVYLGNRSLPLIAVILFFVLLFLTLIRKRKGILTILGAALCVLILFGLYQMDAFGAKTWFEGSYFNNRIQGGYLSSERWDTYGEILGNFWAYFFGGLTSGLSNSQVRFAHNIWLDVYIQAGIIPLLLIAAYTVRTFVVVVKMRKNKSFFAHAFSLSVVLGIALCCAIEPILQADPYWFASCCGCIAILEKYSLRL